jgi:hypothetical protein
MQKILELTEKQFITGIAPSSQVQDKGLWYKAKGINFAGSTFLEDNTAGVLQPGPALTDLTGSEISDRPIAYDTDVSDASNAYMYVWGDAGHLYRVTSGAATKLSTVAPMGSAANGLFVMNHTTGQKRAWFFRIADIGSYGNINGTPSFNAAVYTTNIVSTKDHATHRFFDRIYFCNGRYIGTAEDDGSSGLTVNAMALDFEYEFKSKTISNDGNYLVVGITTSVTTDGISHGVTKVVFWDTVSSSWQREWNIPAPNIIAVRQVGSTMIAVTTRGIFSFTFNTPPQLMQPFLPLAFTPDYQYPGHFAVDVLGEAIAIGSDAVATFGKLTPALPNALMQPFSGINASQSITMVATQFQTGNIYIGTTDSKLYVTSPGTPTLLTGVSAETIHIDLQRWWQIGRIVVNFDGQLASGDSVSVSVDPDYPTSSTSWGTASYASHGAIRTKEMYGSKEARKLKLIFTFNSGAVRIRNVEVWGDPIAAPTHTRV